MQRPCSLRDILGIRMASVRVLAKDFVGLIL